jgi:DUF1680 family protein
MPHAGSGHPVPIAHPVPHTAVTLADPFWAPRQRANHEHTLPAIRRHLEQLGRFQQLRHPWHADEQPALPIWSVDLMEWIEVAAYSLATHPDPALEADIDRIAALVPLVQEPDGYLRHSLAPVPPHERWRDLRDSHRLYTAGHFFEAAIAYYEATGKRTLLNVACRYADHIATVFGRAPNHLPGYDGHEEIELALVRLFDATGEVRYLQLASYFVEQRGQRPNFFLHEPGPHAHDDYFRRMMGGWTPEYNQSHAPVREQAEVVGHAVRAMYLYCAMTDLARAVGDTTLLAACQRLWEHLVTKRLYITGGLGSSHHNEGMTEDYDLLNETAYCETCAAVGLVMWNHRLLQIDGDGRYADLMERTLYNNVAAGVALDGTRFFYVNPLASRGDHHRQAWFDVACCPPNVARLIASLGRYMYAHRTARTGEVEILVHLYAHSEARVPLATGAQVVVRQETNYPWDGDIAVTVDLEQPCAFALSLRIPGWCTAARMTLNDEEVAVVRDRGYTTLRREWRAGDVVRLHFDMPIVQVRAHPQVCMNAGRIALQRGPIVYCLEQVDNGANLAAIAVPPEHEWRATFDATLLGGVVTVRGPAERVADERWEGTLYQAEAPGTPGSAAQVEVCAVPYAVWDNRAPGEMVVWVREGCISAGGNRS